MRPPTFLGLSVCFESAFWATANLIRLLVADAEPPKSMKNFAHIEPSEHSHRMLRTATEWDTFACDVNGNHTTGIFVAPSGVVAAVTANRLLFRQGTRALERTLEIDVSDFEVFAGCFEYEGVNVFAERGPKRGIYGVVWVEEPLDAMFFIAVDGMRDGQYVGLEWPDLEFFRLLLARGEQIGCLRQELAFLPTVTPLRFNQEDARFAREHGVTVPRTPPGEAVPPMVSELVQNWRRACA